MSQDTPSPAQTRLLMLENDFIYANELGARLRRSEATSDTIRAHLLMLAAILAEMDELKHAQA